MLNDLDSIFTYLRNFHGHVAMEGLPDSFTQSLVYKISMQDESNRGSELFMAKSACMVVYEAVDHPDRTNWFKIAGIHCCFMCKSVCDVCEAVDRTH